MRLKIHYTLLLFLGLFALSAIKAEAAPLRDCTETVCSKIFHNKELGKATAVIWQGEGNILTSYTFDLDSSAVLVHQSGSVSTSPYNATSEAPPAPCQTGSCSTPRSTTYETATEVITVTITFTYFNGQLIDATVQRTVKIKPPEIER